MNLRKSAVGISFVRFLSQRKSPFASEFWSQGNRASWGHTNRAILRGSGKNRLRNRRESPDFGAPRVSPNQRIIGGRRPKTFLGKCHMVCNRTLTFPPRSELVPFTEPSYFKEFGLSLMSSCQQCITSLRFTWDYPVFLGFPGNFVCVFPLFCKKKATHNQIVFAPPVLILFQAFWGLRGSANEGKRGYRLICKKSMKVAPSKSPAQKQEFTCEIRNCCKEKTRLYLNYSCPWGRLDYTSN